MEIMGILDVSRKMAYELCHSGNFKVVRVGRSIRVSKSSFDEWLDNQSHKQSVGEMSIGKKQKDY